MLRRRKRVGRLLEGLPIAHLERLSLHDYPGRTCVKAVIPGCNFRCPYCLNEDLVVNMAGLRLLPESVVIDHLYKSRSLIDALCLGGGEPTLHNGLLSFIYKVKSVGFDIKLDTNGTRPKRIKKLMEERLLDYVSFELKAPLDRYGEVAGAKVDIDAVEQSVRLLRRGDVDHEFRTTMVPGLVDGDDLEKIASMVIGSRRFVIQQFKPGETMCEEYRDVEPYSLSELRSFRDRVAPYFRECQIGYLS